jgi:hypothetical protein
VVATLAVFDLPAPINGRNRRPYDFARHHPLDRASARALHLSDVDAAIGDPIVDGDVIRHIGRVVDDGDVLSSRSRVGVIVPITETSDLYEDPRGQ